MPSGVGYKFGDVSLVRVSVDYCTFDGTVFYGGFKYIVAGWRVDNACFEACVAS